MRRFAIDSMHKWFDGHNRHPLVIRGARQVGKSTLVHDFARSKGLALHEVNLYRNLDLAAAFRSLDPKRICQEISDRLSADVTAAGGILFLDEIQAIPEAIDALRYFYEEMPDFPIVSAGSLLEFALAKHNFSMPVGRIEYMFLGPVTFAEFIAEADPYLAAKLSEGSSPVAFTQTVHQKLLNMVRVYMLVGGMPEAAQSWLDTHNMADASAVHRRIVNTYIDDFAKYAEGSDLALMQSVFRMIPAHVGEKVKYVNYSRDVKAAKVAAVVDLFVKARIACSVVHSDANGIPLGAEERTSSRKLLFLDVGLMNYVNGLTWSQLLGMDEVSLVNEGKIAEQFVGQHLFFRRGDFEEPRLNYWLREGKKGNAEVDYVIDDGTSVLPVEVKAGATGSLKALRQMMLDKNLNRAVRFDSGCFSSQIVSLGGDKTYELTTLPFYDIALVSDWKHDWSRCFAMTS